LGQHLADAADNEHAMIDSTVVRAHQHSAGAKKKMHGADSLGRCTRQPRRLLPAVVTRTTSLAPMTWAEVERLVDHLVLLQAGRVSDLQSDPSLPLAGGREAAVTFDAYDASYGLAVLRIDGGEFAIPLVNATAGHPTIGSRLLPGTLAWRVSRRIKRQF
jgi:hypothetical protein